MLEDMVRLIVALTWCLHITILMASFYNACVLITVCSGYTVNT